jgi:hypothetical protein
MSKKGFLAALLALPLAVAGLVYGQTHKQRQSEGDAQKSDSYCCPLTGEELSCPGCCPLSK